MLGLFEKWTNPALFFVYFHSFRNNLQNKTVDLSEIRTWTIGVEGENTDHNTVDSLKVPKPEHEIIFA